MSYLRLIFGFAGTLIPVIFPKNEFKLQRLIAVMLIMGALAISVKCVGIDDTKFIMDGTEDMIELTEQ